MTPDAILRLAHEQNSAHEFTSALLRELSASIGFDVAMMGGTRELVASLHLDRSLETTARAEWRQYGSELGRLHQAALRDGGVAIDREVLPRIDMERCRYHRDLMQPLGGRSTLVGIARFRGQPLAVLALGRTQTERFESVSQDRLRHALPAIALGFAAHAAGNLGPDVGERYETRERTLVSVLSARERDVLDYLALGLTNAEIGLACGTSVNTVRNQVASLLRKLGAANRTEAVAMVRSDH